MSGNLTRNATEFEKKFRKIRDDYERVFAPQIERWKVLREDNHAGTTAQDALAREIGLRDQDVLEYQMRAWVIDGLLRSLNWIQNTAWNDDPEKANLIPEMSVHSQKDESKRRLDYFGFESKTSRPLLVVEAKRPSDKLPVPVGGAKVHSFPPIIAQGLSGKKRLPREWQEWIQSLRDYAISIKERLGGFPARVVLTNGDWCIVFREPERTFSSPTGVRVEDIVVFESANDILGRSGELYALLEHHLVLGERPELLPGELPSVIDTTQVEKCAYALKLRYSISPTADSSRIPLITMLPIILVKSSANAWLRVIGNSDSRVLPTEYTQRHLDYHLDAIRRDAERLLADVRFQLGREPSLCSVEEHYSDPDEFNAHPGVVESGECWILFTGVSTHFLYRVPSVDGCPFHDWGACRSAGVASGRFGVIGKLVESPRAFFESGTFHHCAHRDVFAAKQSPITSENRQRCGLRSGANLDAFCEIAPFEDYLCCRTCVYQRVCTSSEILRLPCMTADAVQPSSGGLVNITAVPDAP